MNPAADLLLHLRSRGYGFALDGERLRIEAPENDDLTALEVELLVAHKADVIALLQAEPPARTPGWEHAAYDPFGPTKPSVQCPVCGAQDWFRAGDGWTCSTCHPPLERLAREWGERPCP